MDRTVDRRDLLRTLVGGAGLAAALNSTAGAQKLAEMHENGVAPCSRPVGLS